MAPGLSRGRQRSWSAASLPRPEKTDDLVVLTHMIDAPPSHGSFCGTASEWIM